MALASARKADHFRHFPPNALLVAVAGVIPVADAPSSGAVTVNKPHGTVRNRMVPVALGG